MLITILDDGYAYDGSSIENRPLGGAEKGIILLSQSLSNIGHVVRVFNNCDKSIVVNKVSWNPIKEINVAHSDVWIVHNNPKLFNLIENNNKKILWLTSSGLKLVEPENFSVTMGFRPTIVYQGENHLDSIPDSVKSLNAALISPGVSKNYLNRSEVATNVTPTALVTSHPLMGLDWLLEIWKLKIHTKIPWAELHIFSNILCRFLSGKKISDRYDYLIKQIEGHDKFNIRVREPLTDEKMALEMKKMRVHLYPSSQYETGAFSLVESQSIGLPAVVRNMGVAPNRIINGKTGFVTNDDESFIDFSVRFLDDMSSFKSCSEEAKKHNKRSWDKVAQEFIKVIAGINKYAK